MQRVSKINGISHTGIDSRYVATFDGINDYAYANSLSKQKIIDIFGDGTTFPFTV